MSEQHGSVLQHTEPGFDEWAITPRFSLAFAFEEIEWPVVPVAAVSQHNQLTAAVCEDFREKQQRIEARPNR